MTKLNTNQLPVSSCLDDMHQHTDDAGSIGFGAHWMANGSVVHGLHTHNTIGFLHDLCHMLYLEAGLVQ